MLFKAISPIHLEKNIILIYFFAIATMHYKAVTQ